ncbi:hypothetical protein ACFX12_037595 [Malus domestica]
MRLQRLHPPCFPVGSHKKIISKISYTILDDSLRFPRESHRALGPPHHIHSISKSNNPVHLGAAITGALQFGRRWPDLLAVFQPFATKALEA